MNLRVFKTAEDVLAVEISSPSIKSELRWFVPLLDEKSTGLANVKQSDVVRVTFDERPHVVPYFLIRTIQVETARQNVVGILSLEDSINILNNIYDRLAYG